MGKGLKSGRIEEILISFNCVQLGQKSRGMEKKSLYEFTNKPLLKNDVQLKKSYKQSTKKRQSPKIILKKSCPKKSKKKKEEENHVQLIQKKKGKKKKTKWKMQ